MSLLNSRRNRNRCFSIINGREHYKGINIAKKLTIHSNTTQNKNQICSKKLNNRRKLLVGALMGRDSKGCIMITARKQDW